MTPSTPATPEPQHAQASRRLRLRYAGTCSCCCKDLPKGTEAFYDTSARTVRCIACGEASPKAAELVEESGTAGRSAHLEYERRHLARQARIKGKLGEVLGGVVLAVTNDPQSSRAWERGSIGEQRLAEALAGVPDIKVLHDRRVPGTRGNIDHIVIAPAGVFVVDAKLYSGLINIRDVGGFFKTDRRLYVGSRDCSRLAQNMSWQVQAVRQALAGGDIQPIPVITPVLCFVDGEWPLLFPPEEYNGVRLEGKKSIKKLILGPKVLEPAMLEHIHRTVAVRLPPKWSVRFA